METELKRVDLGREMLKDIPNRAIYMTASTFEKGKIIKRIPPVSHS